MFMKRIVLLFVIVAFSFITAGAQNVITGTVTNLNGEGIPGALVKEKNTNNATITDLNGGYSISVSENATVLVFSYMGLKTQELPISGTVVNAVLKEDDTEVEEVVVTAIGVKKSEKKIGYAATTVSGDELTQTKDRSALNALQGKVAGVNITTASGAPGSSTRVIFRGFSTFNGSNQPLYVIDGVPINNASSGSTSLNGGTDFGNGANDIDPETIASITFLKGSGATALYGSRAANGVVVITTKDGSRRNKKGQEISVSSSAKFSTPLRLPQLQDIYGQGIFGNWDQRENTSYGPKFDDQMHYWGHVVDGQRLIKPYSALPNNVADFFDVGMTYQNSIAVTGGGEDATYFLSYSNVRDDGIMPFNFDTYNRNNITLSGTAKLANKFSSSASINYVNKTNRFVPTGQGGQSVWNNVLQQPRDMPILDMQDYKGTFFNKDTYYSPYTNNPYWSLFENGNSNNEDRVYGRVQLAYEPNEYISVLYRVGTDVSNRQTKNWRAVRINKELSEGGFNGDYDDEIGSVSEQTVWNSQLTSDLILTMQKSFFDDNFDVAVVLGHNMNQQSYSSQYIGVSQLDVEGFYHISNSPNNPIVDQWSQQKRIIGAYGNITLNYKSLLNLEINGRNDWTSTLPVGNQSFFYPGVNLGFVFSELSEGIKSLIPYGKLRVSVGQTGNGAGIYQVYPELYQPGRFPLPSGTNGFQVGDRIGNPELSNELTTEIEIGTDLRFWKNRAGIDLTFYNRTTNDLIFDVDLAPSSGYSVQTMNIGTLNNKGVELLVSLTPVKKKNFEWKFSVNFAKNISNLVALTEGLDKVDITGILGGTEHWFRAYTSDNEFGYPSTVGIFEVSKPAIYVDEQGEEHVIVNAQGIPDIASEGYVYGGTSEHDFMVGFSNDITIYRNLRISALVEWRKGGAMHSRTAGMVYFTGISPVTLYNDRQPFIVPNSVIRTIDGEGNVTYIENTRPVIYDVLGGSADSYWDRGGEQVGMHEMVAKDFVKLRSLSITYDLPSKWFNDIFIGGASFSIIGNNLLLWTPDENRFIDPELTTYGNDMAADFGEFGATPSVRTIGFNLSFKF